MTDSSDIAAKAREALEGITPGPWAWYRYGTQFEVFTENVSIAPDDVADVADNLRHLADAEFIAAAPDLIASLLAALETAETKVRAVEKVRDSAHHAAESGMTEDARYFGGRYRDHLDAALGGVS